MTEQRVTWVDEVHASVDEGTMLISVRSGGEQSSWRMSLATFRRYAESGLRELTEHERRRTVLTFPNG